jgi:hypothetical protein
MKQSEELIGRMEQLSGQLRTGQYDGHHDAVRELIADCRRTLIEVHQRLGPWEAAELEYAEAAVGWNFLNLAVVCAHKALQVSLLPRAEYEHGFNYPKQGVAETVAK